MNIGKLNSIIGGNIINPIIIDERDWYKYWGSPFASGNIEKSATKLSNTSFTAGDITGLALAVPIIIETTDNKFYFRVITAVDGTTITINEAITEDFSTFIGTYDVTNGIHMTDNGYRGMGQYLAATLKKYTEKYVSVLDGNFNYGKYIGTGNLEPRVFYASDDSLFLNFTYIPGFSGSAPEFARQMDGTTNDTAQPDHYRIQTTHLGFGVRLALPSLNAGGYVEVSCGMNTYSGSYGEFKVSLLDSGLNEVSFQLVNRTTFFSKVRFDIPTTGLYTLQFANNSADSVQSMFVMSYIQAFNKSSSTNSIFKLNPKIAFLGDSWTENGTGTPKPLRYDGTTSAGMAYFPATVGANISGSTIYYSGLGNTTSEWGRYWIANIIALNPDYIVIHFGINDYNSRGNYPATASAYDFHPTNQWAFLSSASGGVFGSVNEARYVANMKYMMQQCIENNITPILVLNTSVGSRTTSGGIASFTMNLMNGVYN